MAAQEVMVAVVMVAEVVALCSHLSNPNARDYILKGQWAHQAGIGDRATCHSLHQAIQDRTTASVYRTHYYNIILRMHL